MIRLLGLDVPLSSLPMDRRHQMMCSWSAWKRLEAEVKALEGKGPTYEIASEDDDETRVSVTY